MKEDGKTKERKEKDSNFITMYHRFIHILHLDCNQTYFPKNAGYAAGTMKVNEKKGREPLKGGSKSQVKGRP